MTAIYSGSRTPGSSIPRQRRFSHPQNFHLIDNTQTITQLLITADSAILHRVNHGTMISRNAITFLNRWSTPCRGRFRPSRILITQPSQKAQKLSTPRPQVRHHSTTSRVPTPKKRSKVLPTVLICGIVFAGAINYLSSPPTRSKRLNEDTFIPYTITSRETVSPSSFIFTISPRNKDPSPPYLLPGTSSWRYPLWSVEFKQPEVQIARHYTPLVPFDGEVNGGPVGSGGGDLRFYVRAIGGGEMSTYLSRLGVGRDIWLRGPHPGFDVTKRLGSRKRVVFLAGGTGIVPGLQVAEAVLGANNDAQVDLLWAVRKREELHAGHPMQQKKAWWKFWAESKPVEVDASLEAPSPVARQLKEMKHKYGSRLRIQVGIDEEHTQFQKSHLHQAITSKNTDSPLPSAVATANSACRLHSQALHETASEFEPRPTSSCECPPNNAAPPGKNLFMVSGPEGFVSHYAGAKEWLQGQQVQGRVGGVAAQLQSTYPQLANEWLVLKL